MAFKYTEAEFDQIKQLYAAGEQLASIQLRFPDKTVASIRMKLVKAGLYNSTTTKVASTKTTVAKKPATSKSQALKLYTDLSNLVGEALL